MSGDDRPLTDAEVLRECGRALFGERWQRRLARALPQFDPSGVALPMGSAEVRQIATGDRPVPDWWWSALAVLLAQRMAAEPQVAGRRAAG